MVINLNKFDYFPIFLYNKVMRKIIVNKKYDEKKLNKLLLDYIPNLTTNLFYKTLRKKDIKISRVLD